MRNTRPFIQLATLLAGTALGTLPAAGQDIPDEQMVDLGIFGEDGETAGRGAAIAVSADGGTVVGYSQLGDEDIRLVMWRGGDAMDITFTPFSLPNSYLQAGSISGSNRFYLSDDGSTVLFPAALKDGDEQTIYRFRNGAMNNAVFSVDANLIVQGLSGDGATIVGFATPTSPPTNPAFGPDTTGFRYSDADGYEVLPNPAGFLASLAHAVSTDGNVAVGMTANFEIAQAIRWDGLTPETLGQLDGYASTAARHVNADGSTIAGYAFAGAVTSTTRGDAAFVWRDGVMTDIGRLGGTGSISIEAISADGSTVIGQSPHDNPDVDPAAQAFYWRDGEMHEIGYLPTDSFRGPFTIARAVCGDGSVIVGVARSQEIISGNYNSIAFRWEDGVITSLGTLGGHSSYAMDISTDGTTIVGWAENAANERRPFIYRTAMQDFTNLIGSFGLAANEAEVKVHQQTGLITEIATPGCTTGSHRLCVDVRGFAARSASDSGSGIGRRSTQGVRLGGQLRLTDGLVAGGSFGWADPEVRGDSQVESGARAWSVSAQLGGANRWASGPGGRVWYARAREAQELTRGAGLENVVPLTGTANQHTESYGGELHYGFAGPAGWSLSASGGLSHLRTRRGAYAETGGDYPAQYDALQIDRTAMQASLGAAHPLGSATGWVEIGAETDLANDPVVVSGMSDIPGMESFAIASTLKRHDTRGTLRGGINLPLGAVTADVQSYTVSPVYGNRWLLGAAVTLGLQI